MPAGEGARPRRAGKGLDAPGAGRDKRASPARSAPVSSLSSLLALLDSRSFASPWFWLVFAGLWAVVPRNVLGIPSELVLRTRRGEAAPEVLLQWLGLVLPWWRIGPVAAPVLTGLACFLVAMLAVLGFAHEMEAAQALTLLLAPLLAVLALRVWLAQGLARMLAETPAPQAAELAARRLIRHGWVSYGIALISVLFTTFAAALWTARHPFGY